jgi:hypothetical protein
MRSARTRRPSRVVPARSRRSSTASAASRFDASGPPWVRVDGIPVAASGRTIFDGVEAPLNVLLNGDYVAGSVATGGDTPTQPTVLSKNCDNWTLSSSARFAHGEAQGVPDWFSNPLLPTVVMCSQPNRLYCLQQ